jgi:hypothetical protein
VSGRNRRDVAERLHETLTGAGASLLGVIANGFKSGGRGSYGYAYDYSYAPQPPSSSSPTPDGPSVNGAGALAGERSVPSVDG